MTTLPIWVSYLQALATPAIALAGVSIAYSSHRLAGQRRRDELFDRRYEFYLRTRKQFAEVFSRPHGEVDTHWRESLAEEASFLFPSDIVDHILNFRTPINERWKVGHISASFVRPFSNYLRLNE